MTDGHTIAITEATTSDATLVAAVARLVPQLSRSSLAPTVEHLHLIVDDPATTLLLATDGAHPSGGEEGRIVGMLTLAVFMLPTGVRAWIEDVVVDDEARGAGVASALVGEALERAEQRGARTVDLTSRPDREAANRLYQRLGFERRETNVYRRTLRLPR
jgi:ribosomal protein S18 acetylase RimI-like enzyme